MDVEAGLGPAGVGHGFFSGEDRVVHLQQELQQIPGWEREVVQADSEEFGGQGYGLVDVRFRNFDVIQISVVFDRLLHLVQEGYGFAQVQELRLVTSGL